MAKSRFFVICSLVFLLTCFLLARFGDQFFSFLDSFRVYFIALSILLLCLSFFKRYFFICFLVVLAVIAWQIFLSRYKTNTFAYDQKYFFEAEVQKVEVTIDSRRAILTKHDLGLPGNILTYFGLYPEYRGGEIVKVSCQIKRPEPIVTDENSFAYDKYLLMNGIVAICSYPQAEIIGRSPSWLYKIRQYMFDSLDQNLTEPTSSVAKAFILGPQREIPEAVRLRYSQIGLTHILSISGLHMAVIIFILHMIFQKIGLGRGAEWLVMIVMLGGYMLVIDFIAPAARSALMAAILLAGPFIGRKSASVQSLLLVACIFTLANPLRVAYDLSFQLSFLAVLGLLMYTKYFTSKLSFITNRFKIREVLAVTAAAQVLTWPLIMKSFHIFSVVAPLANFILLPASSLLLILGLIVAASGMTVVAQLFSWPLNILMHYMEEIVKLLSVIPYSHFVMQNYSTVAMLVSYTLTIFITILIKKYEKN